MKTLLEQSQENRIIEAKRVENLKMLNDKLNEARLTYAAIGRGSFEQDAERQEVSKEINRLEAYINSEQNALRGVIDEVSDQSVKDILDSLNF